MEYFFTCPYCWEEISFIFDTSEQKQSYIEDCEVCCNPIQVSFEVSEGEVTFFESQKV